MRRFLSYAVLGYIVSALSWVACTPSGGGQKYGAGSLTPTVVPIAGLYGPDAGLYAPIALLDSGTYGPLPGNVVVTLAGDIIGSPTANVAKTATGSDGGFTVNAAWEGHLAAVGNGVLEGVAKCSSLGNICTMTYAIPANTSGKIVVEVSGVTGDGGKASAEQTFTCYVSNMGGTCKAWGAACVGGTLYATDSGTAGAWVPTTALNTCNILVKGTNGTDAGTTVDWASQLRYTTAH